MTKVKICGITNLDDAVAAANAGADALGFNFYRGSFRFIGPNSATAIVKTLAGDVQRVGVFVNESIDTIVKTVDTAMLDAVQLHGDESAGFVSELRKRTDAHIIKAFRISAASQLADIAQYDVDAVLLDSFSPHERGGTGNTFDWSVAQQAVDSGVKVYLAGGLSPENVSEAVKVVQPYAVDACSSLELEKGRKDHEKVKLFIRNAKSNDKF